jgi:hypothetical protein
MKTIYKANEPCLLGCDGVAVARANVSEEGVTSIIMVEGVSEVGKTLAVM